MGYSRAVDMCTVRGGGWESEAVGGSALLDRAVGTILGLAAGDALGAGYEFTHPGPDEPIEMRGGGLGWAPGEWTDDTQMAICVLEEAVGGPIDPHRVGDRFLAWYARGPTDVGMQIRWVLAGARSGADLADRAAAYCRNNPRCAGNGSLMRTAPVALAHLGDPAALAETARAVSDLTHGDPMCGDACVLWCRAIAHAVGEEGFDIRVGLDLVPGGRRGEWERIIAEAEAAPPAAFSDNGWVVTAFQAAWAVIVATPGEGTVHLRDALVAAVRIGGDTDTVAAIAGSLLGARWGAAAIPGEWLRVLNGWPGYTVDELAALVEATVGARDGASGGR
jgi:ADP-ribosyl-[dinitrogen reductase] hydrolase